jgi:outer membrane lipoprotein-sorting protein
MLGFEGHRRGIERHRGSFLVKNLCFLAVLVSGAIVSAVPSATAQTEKKWTLDGAFAMMDRAAKDFRSLSADLENVKYTAVGKDTATESGKIYFRHDQKMRIDIAKPEPRTILRTGDSLFLYNPKLNRVEEYDLGKNRAMVDQYIRLGFGTKSEDLKKSYDVALSSEEELDGKKTLVLDLAPRSDSVRAQITKIQMWIDTSSWLPIQQKFYETGSGDYILFHYTNLMKNLKIADSRFKQDWPKNASHEHPHG